MNTEFSEFVSMQMTKDSKNALYVQLYEALRERMVAGRLSQGYMLPPVRKLAALLGVNAGTVVSAYKLLEQNGYIFSRAGSGSFVAELPAVDIEEDKNESVGILLPQIEAETEGAINLASIALNPDLVSVEQFKEVLVEVLDRDQGYAFGYQDSQGFYPLRESMALHLKRNGVNAGPNGVQIISGAQQGIDLAAKAFLRFGDYVLVENPTYPGAVAAFRSRGAKIVEVPLEEDGIAVRELEEKLRKFRPKLIYVMPNIQNPTGYSYSSAKRNRLMGLARYYDAVVLEDDYISDLSYASRPMAPLKAIDRDDRVIYLKSFSKIFMPGLRLAFLTVPARWTERILSVKHNSDISTSGLTQRAFDLYLRKGIWNAHIGAVRAQYTKRCEIAYAALRRYLPRTVRFARPQGGLSFWLTLPQGISAHAVVEEARTAGVLVIDGAPFFPRQAPDRHFRISFATASAQEIERGIEILGSLAAFQVQGA